MGDALSVPFIVLVLSYDHFHYISSFCLSDLVGFLLLTLNRSLLFQLGEFSASCTWLLKRPSLIFGSKQLGFIHEFVNRPLPCIFQGTKAPKIKCPPRVIMCAITGLVFEKRLFNQRTLLLFNSSFVIMLALYF